MVNAVFFVAFVAFLWLFGLLAYWLFAPLVKMERRSVQEKLNWYRQKTGVGNAILKFMFILFNAHVLFPFRGAIVAVLVILIFVFLQGS